MVIAWYLLGFFGLLVARYAKDIDKDFCGKDLWFRLHQICMITTWILVMIGKNCYLYCFYLFWWSHLICTLCHACIILPLGITLIFVEKGTDPLGLERIKTNAHSLIGLISSILAFIQPFMAFIRPSPESHKRWLFNTSHFLVGTTAFFLVILFPKTIYLIG